ncbi:MAG: PGPGW domain-containing protein [Planctomycetaceae bacterium]
MTVILNTLMAAWRHARRVVVLVVGLTVLAFGVALLVLPGPAFVVIPMGLGILSIEFVWARVWLKKIRDTAEAAATKVGRMGKSVSDSAKSVVPTDRAVGVR